MIYEVKKTIQNEGEESKIETFEIDDLVLFEQQSSNFKDLFKSISQNNIAEFDNANIVLFPESGRVIISKNSSDGI